MITRNRIATMMLAVLTMASWNAADASQKMGGPSSAGINGKVSGTCGQPGCLLLVVHSHSQAHTPQTAVNAKPSPRKTYRKTKMGGPTNVGINGKVLGYCGQPGCSIVVVHSHSQAHTTQPAVNSKPSPRKTYRKTKTGGSSVIKMNGQFTTRPPAKAKVSVKRSYRKRSYRKTKKGD